MATNHARQQGSPITNYIQNLISPPSLSNPLRRSPSEKTLNELGEISPTDPPSPRHVPKASPVKPRSKSEDKPFSIFSSTRNYAQQFGNQNSFMLSKISELSQPPLPTPLKQVRFREHIIHKNAHNKRDNYPQEARTPSILKRSQLLRINTQNTLQSHIGPHLDRQSTLNSYNYNEDRETRASKTNEVVRKRYFTILERFQAKFATKLKKNMRIRPDEKYKDELFPPILSSIYRGGNPRNPDVRIQDIRWVRLPELFKNRPLCLLPAQRSNIQIYCNRWRTCGNFIGDALTCLKDCRFVLEKMFEDDQANEFGVYLVKIFQENVWKYVIIDDYIPTSTDNNGNYVPLFLNICELQTQEGPIEVWPFLLEKAYANYYANYESLHYGNTLDFLEELTGTPFEVFQFSANLKKMAESMRRLSSYLQRENVMTLGHIEQQEVYIPLYRSRRGQLVAKHSYENEDAEVVITLENIFQYFDRIHAMVPSKWLHSAVSTVGLNLKRTPHESPRFDVSLRTLKVAQASTVALTIRQKQKRFYQNSSLNYNYIWNRVILLQKQLDGDCRWIAARYSCSKTINFTEYLEPGEYYILLLPEWKISHCYELSLIALANHPIALARKEYEDRERLIEKGCADLAQRCGRMEQINLYACSYCFVEEEVGFIIENINNERFNGDIRVNRSIIGIRSSVQLIPFNLEFYVQKSTKLPFKTQISVYIPADHSYTVILMTRGGIDLTLLKRFDFAK